MLQNRKKWFFPIRHCRSSFFRDFSTLFGSLSYIKALGKLSPIVLDLSERSDYLNKLAAIELQLHVKSLMNNISQPPSVYFHPGDVDLAEEYV